ncbi:P-loop containing nucleoside triphosphate hydrolase protein, partial [Pisolithus thermaeus]
IVVSVMGPTGAGKSTFIDRAVERPDMGAGHDLTSCTREVRAVRYPHTDGVRNIVLVDTPGFDDTFMTDVQILKRIAHWLNSTYKKNVKLSGLLYLHRISDNRVGGTPLRNYNMFKELCGKDNFKNVILVTTMWDEVTEEVGSAREEELRADFWRAMIALGSTTHRFERTTESAWKIINSLSVQPLASRRPLQIQSEMVDENLPLHRTAAGRTVLNSLNDLMSSFK